MGSLSDDNIPQLCCRPQFAVCCNAIAGVCEILLYSDALSQETRVEQDSNAFARNYLFARPEPTVQNPLITFFRWEAI